MKYQSPKHHHNPSFFLYSRKKVRFILVLTPKDMPRKDTPNYARKHSSTKPKRTKKSKVNAETKSIKKWADKHSRFGHPIDTKTDDDNQAYIVYLIETYKNHKGSKSKKGTKKVPKRTYVGITNDFSRRIRQHNRVISGGARRTRGFVWKPVCMISGFPDKTEALRCEYRLHHPRPSYTASDPVVRRVKNIWGNLQRDKFTSRQTSNISDLKLTIHWANPKYKSMVKHEKKAVEWPKNIKHTQYYNKCG